MIFKIEKEGLEMFNISKNDINLFTKRMITTFILLPIGFFVVFSKFLNGLPLFIFITIINLLILFEIHSLLNNRKFHFYLWPSSIASTFNIINFYLYGLGIYDIGYLFIISILIVMIYLIFIVGIESFTGYFEKSMENIAISFYSFMLVNFSFPLAGIIKMSDITGWKLAIVLLIVFISDAGGLFIGKLFGKHKTLTSSSPSKSIEGYIGEYIFGLSTAIILFFVQKWIYVSTNLNFTQFMIIANAIIISGMIGDLGESTLKRWAQCKDSSDLLPGHGGIFDRFDSLSYALPVYYALLKLFGY